jgi:5'-nucleotidase
MIFLVDMDGVVADFEFGHRRMCEQMGLAPELAGVDRDNWDILGTVSDPAIRSQILAGWHAPGFFADLPPIPGAVNAVHLLASQHLIFFCTAPLKNHATCASEKIAWVSRYFGEEFASRVIISSDKTLVMGDVLVDDRPTIHGVNSSPSWTHHLFAQPYNQKARQHRWNWPQLVTVYRKKESSQ